MTAGKAILLLGRRDEPTDGVADYCGKLQEAAAALGLFFEIVSVPWAEKGWRTALAELRKAASSWRGRWVFLQYTTLAWSRRGFPLRAPNVLRILRQCGARPAIVFHDFMPLSGSGIVGNAREYCHLRVLRKLYAHSDLSIFTIVVNKISWLPLRREKAVFIPVGSNFPEPVRDATSAESRPPLVRTVAVFGITDPPRGASEIRDITYALKSGASKGVRLRLMALGRGTERYESELREALNGTGIELSVLGLLSGDHLIRALASAHILLCVRGPVSSRRGSAVAGIVCGLPIVGYRAEETGFPVTEAGVRLVEPHDREGLAGALSLILTDEKLYSELRQQSATAARKYFSWDAIASQFAEAISGR